MMEVLIAGIIGVMVAQHIRVEHRLTKLEQMMKLIMEHMERILYLNGGDKR